MAGHLTLIQFVEVRILRGQQRCVHIQRYLYPRYQSNNILRAALGYVEEMGYIPTCKLNAITASCVADLICK